MNAKSVMDVANNNPYWNGRLNEAYEMLSDAIFGIYDELSSYLNKEEYYQEGDTNLVYLYADQRNKRIYTNCEAFQITQTWKIVLRASRQWENTR